MTPKYKIKNKELPQKTQALLKTIEVLKKIALQDPVNKNYQFISRDTDTYTISSPV